MRYRTQLLIAFLAVVLLTNGVSLSVLGRLSRQHLFEGYRAKLLSITVTTATMLDPALLAPGSAEPLRLALRRARDANRRPDTQMERVFVLSRSPEDSLLLLVAADAEENPRIAGRTGEVYRTSRPLGDISKAEVEAEFATDEFGTFLRAWAPVYNSAGQFAGAVVVEAKSNWVDSKMLPIISSAIGTMLFASVLALPFAFVVSRRVSRPLSGLHEAVAKIGKGELETRIPVLSKDEFGAMAADINTMAAGLQERDHVKSTFAHFVSQQVMDSILKSGEIRLTGDRRRITVLFCDIRGFTSISESLVPEKIVQLLNDYFETMVDVIFRNRGTLDKFIGDGIMVIFGAPEDDPYQEEHAVRTAIEMQIALTELSLRWVAEGINVRMGIGINSGPAVVGNIGSSKRMDYTAIGDTVNLASRLESATKEFGVGILVSEYTYTAVRGNFHFRNMGPVTVKGRAEAVVTYTVEDV